VRSSAPLKPSEISRTSSNTKHTCTGESATTTLLIEADQEST
jgi:hypothetical protein